MKSFLIAALILMRCAPASAGKIIESVVANVPGSPASVFTCGLRLADPHYYSFVADFVNEQPKPLTAVKVRFVLQDAFGTVQQTNDFSPIGTYSKDTHIVRTWLTLAENMPNRDNIASVSCSIVQTRDSDGNTWKSVDADNPIRPGRS